MMTLQSQAGFRVSTLILFIMLMLKILHLTYDLPYYLIIVISISLAYTRSFFV